MEMQIKTKMRYGLTPGGRLLLKRLKMKVLTRKWRKGNPAQCW
jgi:hypothetical protein